MRFLRPVLGLAMLDKQTNKQTNTSVHDKLQVPQHSSKPRPATVEMKKSVGRIEANFSHYWIPALHIIQMDCAIWEDQRNDGRKKSNFSIKRNGSYWT